MTNQEIIDETSKPKEKLKAWYLFTNEFIAGTQHLNNEQIGIYIRLLCWNWNKGCIGIPSYNMTYYRIANCHSDSEKHSCDLIIKEFFVYINDHYQNEKQLHEYLYITRRMEASKKNGMLGGRPKKEPSNNLDETPKPKPIPTPSTSKPSKMSYSSQFLIFWKDVKNKVSKGIAEKNYLKLEKEWIAKPKELATIYNKYYDSIDDKQFAKQPAYWLSAKKYLDESPIKASEEKLDQYDMRVKMFREAVENKKGSPFIQKYAKQHSYDVKRAIKEGIFTTEEAVKYLDMENWI